MNEKYVVYWAQGAEQDLKSVIGYIKSESPTVARAQLKKILSRVSTLDTLPQRGRVVPELEQQGIFQYREIIAPPWRIIYRITTTSVYVLTLIDSRQNVEDILLARLVR